MTTLIFDRAHELERALDVLSEIELQFGTARFALDCQCVPPNMHDVADEKSPRMLSLTLARHPVLERNLRLTERRIVPISLRLEGHDRQLIISGPNTGGKTVGLKTVGLIALMAHTGIPVPAETADLPVYAANTPGVVNAAVGFDATTLQPTYELKVGVPGASAGINIAQRLGLNLQIIAAARERLAGQTQDIACFLDQLHQQLDGVERER